MESLNYIHWNPSPYIADFGFFALHWYSFFFMMSFLIGYWLMKRYFKEANLPLEQLDKLFVYTVLGGIIGARLGHCLFYDFAYFSKHPLEIILPFKFEPEFRFEGFRGLASHGGGIGLLISLYFYTRKYKVDFLWLLDRLALITPLAGCFIRLGNLMNSEIIGKPATVSWAFVFERVDEIPRHPGQLYEAILYLLIFIFLQLVYRRNPKRRNGFLFGLFLILLFSARFVIEFFKEDQSAFEAGWMLNLGQLLSLPFIGLGVWFLWGRGRREKHG